MCVTRTIELSILVEWEARSRAHRRCFIVAVFHVQEKVCGLGAWVPCKLEGGGWWSHCTITESQWLDDEVSPSATESMVHLYFTTGQSKAPQTEWLKQQKRALTAPGTRNLK